MKKYVLSLSLMIVFTFYVLLESQNSISVVSNSSENKNGTGGSSGGNASVATPAASVSPSAVAPTPSTLPPPAAAPPPTTAGLYSNGSFTGDSVNAYFGNVQVEAIVSGGELTDVKILAYPNDRSTSVRINGAALPKLVQEAISSQNAQVDIVSGATQTSQGFQQSLASALAKAKG